MYNREQGEVGTQSMVPTTEMRPSKLSLDHGRGMRMECITYEGPHASGILTKIPKVYVCLQNCNPVYTTVLHGQD